jgi:hypothetical protein
VQRRARIEGDQQRDDQRQAALAWSSRGTCAGDRSRRNTHDDSRTGAMN